MDLANVYYEQYLDDQAIPLFEKGLEYALISKDLLTMQNAYLNMAVVEENRQDYIKSLEYRKKYEEIQKQRWDRDKVWELAEQQKQHEVEAKQQKINLLEAQERSHLAEIATRQWQTNFFLVISLLLTAIIIGAAWAYQRLRLSKNIIATQKDQLEATSALKNRLFSIVAHDLKSPVYALQQSQNRLKKAFDKKDEKRINALMQRNTDAASRTYKLLNNLLHWALDQSDQLQFMPTTVYTNDLVAMVVYDYEAVLSEKGIKFKSDCDSTLMITADTNMMKIVLRNLLDNAIKFTPEGGDISIRSYVEGDRVCIAIKDSGQGMDAQQLQQLEESHRAAAGTDTDGQSSTGLGLSLCYSLIHRNEGTLRLASEPGKGTTITACLPKTNQPTHE